MTTMTTDMRETREAARRIRFEPNASITATNVQTAIDSIAATAVVAAGTPPAIVPKAVNFAMSPYTVLPTDYLLEVDTTGGVVVIQTQTSASRNNLPFTVKDIALNSSVNRIDVVRTGAETIDGLATWSISTDGDANTFKPKLAGNGYEVET